MAPKVHFIVNPNASNGRCGKVWRRSIERRVQQSGIAFEVHFTSRQGEATEIAQALCARDLYLISVGGDGTHNEVVTGIVRAGVKNAPRLGCLTLGTGGDFRKTLKFPEDPFFQLRAILEDIKNDATVSVDLGRIEYVGNDGNPAVRGFINIASFGIGGQIDAKVNETTKLFGGFASFLIGSFRVALSYDNQQVQLVLDDKPLGLYNIFNVAVANGQYFGGGMHIAPQADPIDGLFDVILLGDLSFRERLAMTPKIYAGSHIDHPKVEIYRARKVEATSEEIVLLDVDGEQPGRLPATFTMLPEAVRLLGGAALDLSSGDDD